MLAVSPSMNHPTFTGITLRPVQWAVFCTVTYGRQHGHILTREPTQVVVNVPVVRGPLKPSKVVISNSSERHVERRTSNLDVNPFPRPILATARAPNGGAESSAATNNKISGAEGSNFPSISNGKFVKCEPIFGVWARSGKYPAASVIYICETI